MASEHTQPTQFINLAPKWASVLPIYLDVLKSGNPHTIPVAEAELVIMAQLADERNDYAKRLHEAGLL